MWKILGYLQRNLIWTIPAMMLAGLATGYLFPVASLRSTIVPLTFLMVYPMMVNLQIDKVFSATGLRCQIVTQAINFALIPFIAYGLGQWFFADRPLIALGLLLAALLPTSGMTITWTGFAKGDINAAIKMTVIGLVVGSIATPLYVQSLMGTVIEIPLLEVFKQIALIVFVPMILGYLTQKGLIRKYGREVYQRDLKKRFPMVSTLGVLGIVFVAMALKADSILQQPGTLLIYLFPLALLYFINFALSTLVGKLFFSRGEGIALIYGTVMRNLSIALAIAMTVFRENGAEIAIIIALAYVVQVQAAAWYVKFSDRIFGLAPEG
ncbi:transporter, arsenite efflux pump ACR3 family [Syntrophotalea carbinolica DSM 2380]|uniref:Transporter, arsenite efflux pump ACR3 family n=1 Tax=Syntrophotalea carbinolica (strain DSM 2380 / NBRC 103641 / GraBd1) TaxID=338963 RepID=Q3A485_SYNC1|nr:bile acid:sodium symporter [Syntrophotalea carbinolica]ABA88822.1 transporter, arsenite efflux pump ACR3 family [Syntrophotalea carbinolica DSM 2380]